MRILLTTPPMQHFNVSGVVFRGFGAYNLSKLAAMLGPEHQVHISDYLMLRLRPHTLAEDIRAFRPDVVGIANPFAGYTQAICEMAQLAKSIDPQIITLSGGQASTYLWREHLDGGFDFVVRHEGEEGFAALIDFLARGGKPGEDCSQIEGLAYRHDGVPKTSDKRRYAKDLDAFPWADRDAAPARRGILTAGKSALVEISRGCPFTCSFCSQPGFWGRHRRRSNDNILDEIEYLARTGHTEICFTDDTVGVDEGKGHAYPVQTAALMEGIIRRQIKVGLGMCMRADTAHRHPRFVALAAEAGLRLVNMGFESYTQDGLKTYGKAENSLEVNRGAAEVLRRHGVLIWGSHIYGAPSQTDEDMAATVALGPKYSDFFRMTMASPIPGSVAFKKLRKEGKVDNQSPLSISYYHYAYKDDRDPKAIQRKYLAHLAAYYAHPTNVAKMVDIDAMKRGLARQSYKGAAFFAMHRALHSLGLPLL